MDFDFYSSFLYFPLRARVYLKKHDLKFICDTAVNSIHLSNKIHLSREYFIIIPHSNKRWFYPPYK